MEFKVESKKPRIITKFRSPEEDQKIKKIIYLTSSVAWLLLVTFLGLWTNSSIFSILLLLIPVFIFVMNYFLPLDEQATLSPDIARGYIISCFFITFSVYVYWQNPTRGGTDPKFKKRILMVIIVSFVIMMLGILDFFPSQEYTFLMSQVDSVFNTISITLLAYAVIEFVTHEYL